MLVTGLLSVFKSPTAPHTSDQSTKPEAPTSDSSQQTNHAENLPDVLTGRIDAFLGPLGASDFSQTNKKHRQGSAQHFFRQRLKPECRVDGRNFIEDFGDPAKRLDRFVPIDPVGKKYLARLGISGLFTTEKIKNGDLTIRQALSKIAKINAALSEYELEPLEIEILNNPVVRDCVVAGRVKEHGDSTCKARDPLKQLIIEIDRFGRQSLINLASPAVQKYLNSYDLTLIDALEMSSDTLAYLESPDAQAKFESQRQFMDLDLFLQ